MKPRTDVRLAGAGGQGVAMAGKILAEAALISGRHAAFSQVYGPESRGGASRSDVVISDSEIGFPLTRHLDVLVLLTPEAARKFSVGLDNGTLVVADERAAETGYPIIDTSRRITGGIVATGVVALGVLESLCSLVGVEALERAVIALAPKQHRDANLRAIASGLEMGAAR